MGEMAAILTALAGLCGVIFTLATKSNEKSITAYVSQIADLQQRISDIEEDRDTQLEQLRKDFEYQRNMFAKQLDDMRAAMVRQENTISRQESIISDYSRHVGKLERLMVAAGIPVPDFETSATPAGRV